MARQGDPRSVDELQNITCCRNYSARDLTNVAPGKPLFACGFAAMVVTRLQLN